jgi:hypothetical protein
MKTWSGPVMKKFIAVLLALTLSIGCFSIGAAAQNAPSADNFVYRYPYIAGQFQDVDENAWYGMYDQAVIWTAYALGIVNGMGDGTFLPQGNLKISEAVKMAAVLHNLYNGGYGVFDITTKPWYKNCVDYALENGIIGPDDFRDFDAYITRAQLAHLIYNALPQTEYPSVNVVNAVGDVSAGSLTGVPHAEEIMALYRAGVLAGDAGTRLFRPSDRITRAEAAALVARAAVKSRRQAFEILPDSGDAMAHPEYAVYNEKGKKLVLGYQDADALKNYFTAFQESSQVWDQNPDTKLYAEDYLSFEDVRYLKANKAGGGIYIFGMTVNGVEYSLSNGIHCGSTESALKAAYAPGALQYEDHTQQVGYWGGADGTYTYYPGNSSPWCRSSFDVKNHIVVKMNFSCSIY